MSIATALEGLDLPGKKRPGAWRVLEKLSHSKQNSTEKCSVGYRVQHSDGTLGFLKASDIDLMTSGDDMLARLFAATELQTFERAILNHCQGSNMDRVVTPLDYGDDLRVYESVRQPLFWIVFELAKCDARMQMNINRRLDFSWSLTALHNLSTAVSQLHGASVSHNDIKPSNLLVFDDLLQKLGDLGSATSPSYPALHDGEGCIGDARYAAPETVYSDFEQESSIVFASRRASDLYLLGSMAFFFMTGTMLTPAVLSRMLEVHQPHKWGGGFQAILPYWRQAFADTLMSLRRELPANADGALTNHSQRFVEAVKQLCEPDPSLRGHPLSRNVHGDPYSVERYIALFDLLRKSSLN
ncbi:hypothetical protein [Mesorhizobium sp. M0029]|uniref:protein kinase domain-containing protein n=1 Tax=Mesorhizobium sp. M0029 TaxID=2956850 RepID=UPI00333AC1D9